MPFNRVDLEVRELGEGYQGYKIICISWIWNCSELFKNFNELLGFTTMKKFCQSERARLIPLY